MHSMNARAVLTTEFTALMLLTPITIWWFGGVKLAMAVLWLALIGTAVYLHRQPDFNWREEWHFKAINGYNLGRLIARWLPCALVMIVFTWLYQPVLLFRFVRERPEIWIFVVFLYPLLSALPQEIIYRSFFFKRYEALFGKGGRMIVASMLVFALIHIVFNNWVAPLLCLFGGYIFAETYQRTRSLALVTLEHALYGLTVFTVGLGPYFYRGGAAMIAQLSQ